MSKLTHDQKRKKKLAERRQKSPQSVSLAYSGQKYKKEKFALLWMYTESGIYEAYALTDRKLSDQMVASAIERLILQMRSNTLPPLADEAKRTIVAGDEQDVVIDRIRRTWAEKFAIQGAPPKDDLIGILRSILDTIDSQKEAGPFSQGYLRYIASDAAAGTNAVRIGVDSEKT